MPAMQMTLVGAGTVGVTPDIVIGSATSYVSGTDALTYTTSGLGAVASDERALVICIVRAATAPTFSSATINGQAMTLLADQSPLTGNRLCAFVGPVGETGQVTVTYTGTTALRFGCTMWPIKNLQSTTAVATATVGNTDPATTTINVSAGGAIFGLSYNANGGSYSWTNLTEAADMTVEGTNVFSTAAAVFTSAVVGQSVTADNSTTISSASTLLVSIR